MDQNLARLQNPHRFLRENRFLEGEDPSKSTVSPVTRYSTNTFLVVEEHTYFLKRVSNALLSNSLPNKLELSLNPILKHIVISSYVRGLQKLVESLMISLAVMKIFHRIRR